MWHGSGWMGHTVWYGWGGIVMGLLILIILVAAVFFMFNSIFSNKLSDREYPHRTDPDEALNILRERFAKGELSEEEFDKMEKIIKNR